MSPRPSPPPVPAPYLSPSIPLPSPSKGCQHVGNRDRAVLCDRFPSPRSGRPRPTSWCRSRLTCLHEMGGCRRAAIKKPARPHAAAIGLLFVRLEILFKNHQHTEQLLRFPGRPPHPPPGPGNPQPQNVVGPSPSWRQVKHPIVAGATSGQSLPCNLQIRVAAAPPRRRPAAPPVCRCPAFCPAVVIENQFETFVN